MDIYSKYETVVGLEVHIQLNTLSKAFAGDENTFGKSPNQHTSAITLAHPGTLPVINREQVQKAIRLGLALNCEINQYNYFDRKHYFYPDLPKGYQITQDGQPICIGGQLNIQVGDQTKTIVIHHIHMEEDAGKSVHDQDPNYSLLDLNRAGTPLLELVTEPNLDSGADVFEFIAELQKLLRYLNVSDADMEKGSMRCDCNVSVRLKGATELGERCEIKNLNSKRFAKQAVEFEAKRQIEAIERGESIINQTRHFNVDSGQTETMREKEGAHDYRYFPDPDLTPIIISDDELTRIKMEMPVLPWARKKYLIKELGVSSDFAEQLVQSIEIDQYYDTLRKKVNDDKLSANFLINQLLPHLSETDISIDQYPIAISTIVDYLLLVKNGKITASTATQRLWPKIREGSKTSVAKLAEDLGILVNSDENFLDEVVKSVLAKNPDQVAQFKKGKKALLGFFIGAVMRESKGSADPKKLKETLISQLNNL